MPPTQPTAQPTPPEPPAEKPKVVLPPGLLPESERDIRDIWEKRLPLQMGSVTGETRKLLGQLLGTARAREIPKKPDPLVMDRVLRELAVARKGLYPFIHEADPRKASKRILRVWDSTAKKEENKTLIELVEDPDSREAQALAWLWEEFVKDQALREKLAPIIDKVNGGHVQDAQALLQAKTIYENVLADNENLNLGELGTTGTTIGDLEKERNSHLAYAVANPGTKGAISAERSARELKGQIEKLEHKRNVIEKNVRLINGKLGTLSKKPGTPPISVFSSWTDTEIKAIAKNISALHANPKVKASSGASPINVTLGDKTKEIGDWLIDDDLPSTADSLTKRYRSTGGGRPQARIVLDEFLREQFGSSLYGMSPEEKEKHFADLKAALLSEEGAASAPSAPPSGAAPTSAAPPSRPSGAGGAPSTSATQPSGGPLGWVMDLWNKPVASIPVFRGLISLWNEPLFRGKNEPPSSP